MGPAMPDFVVIIPIHILCKMCTNYDGHFPLKTLPKVIDFASFDNATTEINFKLVSWIIFVVAVLFISVEHRIITFATYKPSITNDSAPITGSPAKHD